MMVNQSPPTNGWTTITSHAFFVAVLEEMDRRYEQRFEAQEKAVSAALSSAQVAVAKAETAAEKRFEGLNELREVVTSMLSAAMPRKEAETGLSLLREKFADYMTSDNSWRTGIEKRISDLDKKIDVTAGVMSGHKDTRSELRANVAIILSAGALLVMLFNLWLPRASSGGSAPSATTTTTLGGR
jgi:hypothetical protein